MRRAGSIDLLAHKAKAGCLGKEMHWELCVRACVCVWGCVGVCKGVCVYSQGWEILRCHSSNGEASTAVPLTNGLSVDGRRKEGKRSKAKWLNSCANVWPPRCQCASFAETKDKRSKEDEKFLIRAEKPWVFPRPSSLQKRTGTPAKSKTVCEELAIMPPKNPPIKTKM